MVSDTLTWFNEREYAFADLPHPAAGAWPGQVSILHHFAIMGQAVVGAILCCLGSLRDEVADVQAEFDDTDLSETSAPYLLSLMVEVTDIDRRAASALLGLRDVLEGEYYVLREAPLLVPVSDDVEITERARGWWERSIREEAASLSRSSEDLCRTLSSASSAAAAVNNIRTQEKLTEYTGSLRRYTVILVVLSSLLIGLGVATLIHDVSGTHPQHGEVPTVTAPR
jgi:hypothetical protein